jgi:hypothetical protein
MTRFTAKAADDRGDSVFPGEVVQCGHQVAVILKDAGFA